MSLARPPQTECLCPTLRAFAAIYCKIHAAEALARTGQAFRTYALIALHSTQPSVAYELPDGRCSNPSRSNWSQNFSFFPARVSKTHSCCQIIICKTISGVFMVQTLRPSPTALLNPCADPIFKILFTTESPEAHQALTCFLLARYSTVSQLHKRERCTSV